MPYAARAGLRNLPPGVKVRQVGRSIELLVQTKPGANVTVQPMFNRLELVVQGGGQLAVTERVRDALLKLFRSNRAGYAWLNTHLSKGGLPGTPADFAAMAFSSLFRDSKGSLPCSWCSRVDGSMSPATFPDARSNASDRSDICSWSPPGVRDGGEHRRPFPLSERL